VKYELAKELKDAGFPQFFSEGMSYYDKKGTFVESACSEYNDDQDWNIRVPTLSELIEACGDGFEKLHLAGGKFHAVGDGVIWGVEDTPEEAVARLWLALHTPENPMK